MNEIKPRLKWFVNDVRKMILHLLSSLNVCKIMKKRSYKVSILRLTLLYFKSHIATNSSNIFMVF